MSTRETLMQAAGELIVESGYDRMTTAAVAKRAGVSEGTIYRHFPSKEALAEAVFAEFWRLFNAFMREHLPDRGKPIERLEAFFPTTLQALATLIPCFGTLIQQEHLYYAFKHGSKSALPDGALEFVALLEDAIRVSQAAGRVRAQVDPRIAAHFFFFGAGQAIDFFGNLHVPGERNEILEAEIAHRLQDLMIHALYGEQR